MTDQVVGLVARVVSAVGGGARPGEVVVAVRGGRETYIAFGDQPIGAGETVLIVGVRAGRQVEVVPWPAAPDGVDPLSG
ncbi:hypothetical protein [Mycobacterium branderi]|uniref:NfeD-like C-terminal domain-containing protein n=1 Tax=Mycobacterium branderi TaxID=43348 RepID=A0A7I7WEP4_9MYCO|nr:hypothetical protein [Mycobacterium branderi]MCV7231815.1 hypothetical protein [Mycobacterium branderi]ORA40232.1 hypothetical protein BST20_06635 [Mycobacterium branderi]BBZ15530.1 hypothetical protein MBRA_57250 [Mycobacterium branderi]